MKKNELGQDLFARVRASIIYTGTVIKNQGPFFSVCEQTRFGSVREHQNLTIFSPFNFLSPLFENTPTLRAENEHVKRDAQRGVETVET